MMRNLLMLVLLSAVVAAVLVTQATAKPPGANGLLSFTRFDPVLEQDVVYTVTRTAATSSR